MVVTMPEVERRRRSRVAVIDCDIHNTPPNEQALYPYLPQRWRRYHELFGMRDFSGGRYPRANPMAARRDAWPPSGGPPGSDLAFLREQLLDAWGIEYGILNPLIQAHCQLHLEYGAAMARAINDWMIAEWLEPEPRLRASICVSPYDADLAAQEIDRLGSDPRFVQVLFAARTSEPLGRRRFWKIYEAAQRHDLPVGVHFGSAGGVPITGAGWPSYYIEDHCGMPQTFQAHLTSLVCEGVFEHFPGLKFVAIEGGFAWLPALMWRLDRSWRRLREEVPHLRRAPSEYLREHLWLTTQPMEEPARPEHFHQLLEHLDMTDRLMFATDYPHWDFDAPDQALPVKLPVEVERKIMAENARALFRFEAAGAK